MRPDEIISQANFTACGIKSFPYSLKAIQGSIFNNVMGFIHFKLVSMLLQCRAHFMEDHFMPCY